MSIIGNKLVLKLQGDTEEETLKLINENRKKICELLVRAYNENNAIKMINFTKTLNQLESFAESVGEKEEPNSTINGERKRLCKSIIKTIKRNDPKAADEVNEYLFNLAELESMAEYTSECGGDKAKLINGPGFYALEF